jgi:hypothetical protein
LECEDIQNMIPRALLRSGRPRSRPVISAGSILVPPGHSSATRLATYAVAVGRRSQATPSCTISPWRINVPVPDFQALRLRSGARPLIIVESFLHLRIAGRVELATRHRSDQGRRRWRLCRFDVDDRLELAGRNPDNARLRCGLCVDRTGRRLGAVEDVIPLCSALIGVMKLLDRGGPLLNRSRPLLDRSWSRPLLNGSRL